MIEFSCVYCGQQIRANEELAGKTTACPACGHSIIVRGKEPGEAIKSAPSSDSGTREDAEDWQAKSDQEIFDHLLFRTLPVEDRRRLAAGKLRWLPIPRCDDVTLFALSSAFSLLWFINPGPATDLREAFSLLSLNDVRFVPALTILAAIVSLINLLLQRPRSDREEFMMLLFVVTVAAGTGVHAGRIAVQEHLGWLMIFPAWNILSSVLLLLLFRLSLTDSDSLGRGASLLQVIFTAAAITALLAICQYRFKLHWAITFSILICYIVSLHNTIRGVSGGRPAISTARHT